MKTPSLLDINEAHGRISSTIHRTPLLSNEAINKITGANVLFKCENFQRTGSFKLRGGTNAIFSLSEKERANGIATHSSGNHAQAVAYAASKAGSKSFIVMPENAPEVKKKAVKGYGGIISFCKPLESERIRLCNEIIEREGAIFISPFEHPDIIAGQATCSKEIFEEDQSLDYILCPVGGGGLSAGTALSVEHFSPKTKFIIAEPEMANDTAKSFRKGSIVPISNPNTIADGLKVTVGDLNFKIIKRIAEDVITVTEEQIVDAMRIVWERMKIIIEPSSAVPVAVLMNNQGLFRGKRIAIIITGGNVDIGKLPF